MGEAAAPGLDRRAGSRAVRQLLTMIAPAAVAALAAWLLTPASAWLAAKVGAIDQPGPRRVHTHPMPRLGGLAVVASTAAVLAAGALGVPGAPAWAEPRVAFGILAGLLPILAVSVRDDMSAVRPLLKFVAHAAGAGIAMSCGVLLPPTVHLFNVPLSLGWLVVPLSALWLIGLTNAFNLVDGLDGLSAGLGLISAASLAAVLLMTHESRNAAAVIVLAGSIIGFLPYNIHPARVFLGDCGATAIGYLLACFTLIGFSLLSSGLATLIPVLLVGVPLADTLVSMVRRTVSRGDHASGGRVYEADRNHIHHRLLTLGLSHQGAVTTLYAAGGLLSLVALASLLLTQQQSGLLLLGILIAGFVGLKRLGYSEFAPIRSGAALRLYDLPVLQRAFFVVFVDIAVVAAALYLSVGLKYDDWHLARTLETALSMFAVLTPTSVIAFMLLGMYRASWRLEGVDAYRRLGLAVIGGAAAATVLMILFAPQNVPLSLVGVYVFVAFVLASGIRVSFRIVDQARMQSSTAGDRTLIYGAGVRGAGALREMLSNPSANLVPVGFLDDNPTRTGKTLNGHPILGGLAQIEDALASSGARVVVVASDRIPWPKVAEARRICASRGVRLLRMRVGFEAVPITEPRSGPDPSP
jgi:UDP-GlcNAc:undecaprenyl-phosphate/decaprenyl-phosphate GlcNAc-1-phosphate transferase